MSLKTILMSKPALATISLVAGGVIATLFFQEVIIKKKTEETKATISQLRESLKSTQEKLIQREKDISIQKHVVKVEVTHADGTKTVTTTSDTAAKIAEKIREEEKAKFESEIAALQADYQHKILELSIHKNPKRLSILAGADVRYAFGERVYSGIISYHLWGPFLIGLGGNSRGAIAPMIGITF